MSDLETNVVHCGDALATLCEMPDRSVNCVVTSPPYFGLRDYGVDGQIGLEPTHAEYVARMVAVFREVRRVLRDDGTLWLNLGDSYARSAVGRKDDMTSKVSTFSKERVAKVGYGTHAYAGEAVEGAHRRRSGDASSRKQMLGIPWRVAFALQDDGWILRSDIIWNKPSCMPESVKDRPTRSHEYVFLFAKSERYWYDADAIKEKIDTRQLERNQKYSKPYAAFDDRASVSGQPGNVNNKGVHSRGMNETRNARTVWTLSTEPTPFAHFATMPQKLVRRCIVAGCLSGGVVLDPFFGSGTTGLVARQEGRRYIGIELNPEYVALAQKRLADDYTLPMLFDTTEEAS